MKPIFLAGFFFLLFQTSKAQDIEVGLADGGMYYLGDLNPGTHFLNTQVAYGLMVRYTIDTRWAVKVSAMQGKIKGNASGSSFLPDRGLAFTSQVTDIAAVAEFNFMPYFTGSRKNGISPYIYTGFSVFFYEPVNNGISLRGMGTEGQNEGYEGRKTYATYNFSIPFGFGAKFSLARRLGLQVYWEMHKTFGDYLDDVSTTYYLNGQAIDPDNLAEVASDPTLNHQPGMQRGNASNNDWFAVLGLSITYKFSLLSSKKCRDLEHQ